ncbi:hypothetical protein OYC64_004529 [Pagothenia borchgrevinki]|uniref:Uncharacterized protein n=1 Tax=Pagothenia borchgrevinki TaxID=8213 RepID=A0ABD2FXK4_PAGBO
MTHVRLMSISTLPRTSGSVKLRKVEG